MVRGLSSRLLGGAAVALVVCAAPARDASRAAPTPLPPPPPPSMDPAAGPSAQPASVKAILADEIGQLEKELAARMMRRPTTPADKRPRLEIEIDLRIIRRAVAAIAADAKPDTREQMTGWLRNRQLRDAIASVEAVLAETPTPTSTQLDAIGLVHKLSYNKIEPGGLDDLCKQLAQLLASVANPTPVNTPLPPMRPKPAAHASGGGSADGGAGDGPATVNDLADQVQRLAAISIPLRQQLLALAATATAAADPAEQRSLHAMLAQSVALARGLQSNTAVSAESRAAIEAQLAEGIVLYSDPRTREAGRGRVDALGSYRQTLTRIGKMGLSAEQMAQLAPAFTYAQSNPESGAKILGAIEAYFDLVGKYDMLPQGTTVPVALKRPLDDARAQFAKARAQFPADAAARPGAVNPDDQLQELRRLAGLVDSLQSMQASFDAINAFKIRPVGGLEKKVTTAALAAVNPTPSANRADGQRYLASVHALARTAQSLGARPLTDVPAATAAAWAGGKVDLYELRWKQVVVELANALNAGTIDLDKAKLARLEQAQALADALRGAAQLDAAQPKLAALSRWADWAAEPAAFDQIWAPYRAATAAAFAAFASDAPDTVEQWQKTRARYAPIAALVLRDTAAYAEPCQTMPGGVPGDLGRLAAPLDAAPFAAERYATFAVGCWATYERLGEHEAADKVSAALARRLAADLRLKVGEIEDSSGRPPRKRPL